LSEADIDQCFPSIFSLSKKMRLRFSASLDRLAGIGRNDLPDPPGGPRIGISIAC
jgi:hypothetical protein